MGRTFGPNYNLYTSICCLQTKFIAVMRILYRYKWSNGTMDVEGVANRIWNVYIRAKLPEGRQNVNTTDTHLTRPSLYISSNTISLIMQRIMRLSLLNAACSHQGNTHSKCNPISSIQRATVDCSLVCFCSQTRAHTHPLRLIPPHQSINENTSTWRDLFVLIMNRKSTYK